MTGAQVLTHARLLPTSLPLEAVETLSGTRRIIMTPAMSALPAMRDFLMPILLVQLWEEMDSNIKCNAVD
jgi:hypothetical protein